MATVTPVQGFVPLHVTLTSTGTSDPDGDPLQLEWSFGDGGGAATASATHDYMRSGTEGMSDKRFHLLKSADVHLGRIFIAQLPFEHCKSW